MNEKRKSSNPTLVTIVKLDGVSKISDFASLDNNILDKSSQI